MANEEITKVAEVNQLYMMDFLQFLTYSIQKSDAEEAEDKFQDQQRKLRKGR